LVASSFLFQISTKPHLASKGYGGSGQKSDDFNTFSKGDSALNYMHVMVQSHGMLKTMSSREFDGGAAIESGRHVLGSDENTQTAAFNGVVQGRITATRSDTAAMRLSRTKAHARTSMASSSNSTARSSERHTVAIMVKELSSALASAKEAHASAVVVQALERQLMDFVEDCATDPKRARGYSSDNDDLDAGPLACGDREKVTRGGRGRDAGV